MAQPRQKGAFPGGGVRATFATPVTGESRTKVKKAPSPLGRRANVAMPKPVLNHSFTFFPQGSTVYFSTVFNIILSIGGGV